MFLFETYAKGTKPAAEQAPAPKQKPPEDNVFVSKVTKIFTTQKKKVNDVSPENAAQLFKSGEITNERQRELLAEKIPPADSTSEGR